MAKKKAFGQDLMRGEAGAEFGKQGAALDVGTGGVLYDSPSAADPGFYHAKRAAEAALGRTLTTAEFLADHYTAPDGSTIAAVGTSIFDPVLAELIYRWFSPVGGVVLDPFAGGSVRGIVASFLGRRYVGIDLSARQVEANRLQAQEILLGPSTISEPPDFMPDLTPVERRGDVWVKRDDLFRVAGVQGGKARTCWALAKDAVGLVTAGSRQSPQANIVAQIARRQGIPCRVHTPEGELSPELLAAQAAGADVVQHKAGYNNVIIARARTDAAERGWTEIPFGMECEEATLQTRRQVRDLPSTSRIVVPVGSGMTLAGVLWGIVEANDHDTKVLGVVVGADPEKRLDRYAPPGWRDMVTLVRSPLDYHVSAPVTDLHGLSLDPIYEAKCLSYLQPGDLLWDVGIRQTATGSANPKPLWIVGDSSIEIAAQPEDFEVDLVFSCPPYADLERYSDDPRDLSTLAYPEFLVAYRSIIRDACARLKPNRFAVFVVGDVRGPDGNYYGLPGDTVQAFRDAGLALYNDAVLVTPAGSVPIRAARQFLASRKLGKTHQNVLVFVRGDAKAAAAEFGFTEYGEAAEEE
jgi:1-aminocyclopropane-1-carboxylate deaminase/D-cysteine desulfhydrase-like pyridoxal-dependent ACC family enzyme